MRYLIHHLLQEAAVRHPEAVALVDGERAITYAQLDERSSQLAHLLGRLGVARGDRVGLYLDKSLESVLGIYAVLKAGSTYVPLDPTAPPARLAYISADCGIRCLLSGVGKAADWRILAEEGAPLDHIVALDGDPAGTDLPASVRVVDGRDLGSWPTSPPSVLTIDQDLAYILYTSGSTGRPKGVMLSHLNGLAFVRWAAEQYDITANDRLSSHAPLHFDLSVFDLFASAHAGARVVLVPPTTSVFPMEVRRFIEQQEITVWYSVPPVLSLLAMKGNLSVGALPRLRAVLFAGEVFPTKYLRQLMSLLPHVRFANLYGPTETNVCTHYDVTPLPDDQTEPIPIGQSIDNVEVFAVAEHGSLAAIGEVGELYVRGNTVMHGYWGDPDKTTGVLGASPLGGPHRDPAYRTGDLVERQPDGNYRFLGRRDGQVKSRGYRIELGEIEAALYSHPAVLECAVVAVPDDTMTNRIEAFLVSRHDIEDTELVRHCGASLPRYMIPDMFHFAEGLPKTSTGKVDRQALLRAALAGGSP